MFLPAPVSANIATYLRPWLQQVRRPFKSSLCVACELWTDDVLCSECLQLFLQDTQRCSTCALPVLAQLNGVCDCSHWACLPTRSLALVNYTYPWNRIIAQLKYQQQVQLTEFLSRQMMKLVAIQQVIQQADYVCPVPLSDQKIRQRGYNQAYELVKKLAKNKAQAQLILRMQQGAAQATLNRQQRLTNLAGVFQIDPFQIEKIQNKKIVLVDDVLTTGATVQAVCQVLKNAGVAEVSVLVLARTLSSQQATLLSLNFP